MSKTITSFQTMIIVITVLATLPLYAQPTGHYRWKDSEGNTHYSDRPPPGVESEFIKFATGKRSAPPVEEKQNEKNSKEKNAAKGKRMMEILPEKNPALCKQAQANLTALDGARIRITEPNGSQRFLSEEEKEDQRANARKFIELHCD